MMEEEKFRFEDYLLTTDPALADGPHTEDPVLRNVLEEVALQVMEGAGEEIVGRLLELIVQYPRNPQLKNYLMSAYSNMGREDKVKETNRWILKEHPDYLFALLNLAAEYYLNGEYEKIPEVLGEEMELKHLYPGREIFHVAELTGFLKMAVLYYAATGNMKAAESRLELLKELAPDSPDTLSAGAEMGRLLMRKGLERWEEEEKTKIRVVPEDGLPAQSKEPPVFEHEIVHRLYEYDLDIPSGILDGILALPRESLIADLERILDDILRRYDYYRNEEDGEEWKQGQLEFPVHAIMLLGELRAEEALPRVLEVLRQDEKFLDFWFGDHLTVTLWEPLYHLGQQHLDLLDAFMRKPALYTYAKTVVSEAVTQIAFHQPERKEEIRRWYAGLFDFFVKASLEDNVIDSDLLALMISDVIDLHMKSLLPLIRKLYELNYVSKGISGDYRSVEKDISGGHASRNRRELMGIKERYEDILASWPGYGKEEEEEADIPEGVFPRLSEDVFPPEPLHRGPRVGRNDPCPCGSGKKYKNCCWAKDKRDGRI